MLNIIKTRLPPVSRRANQALHGGIGLLMVVALALCALIKPDPSGIGTHQQLGLPGCLVCRVLGIQRCPSCGMTTGFAHLMRGQWQRAKAANPAAPVVFVIWCLVMCYCLAIAISGLEFLAYEIPAITILFVTGFVFWIVALVGYLGHP
jgi:FtsH-binding integral membrane protein